MTPEEIVLVEVKKDAQKNIDKIKQIAKEMEFELLVDKVCLGSIPVYDKPNEAIVMGEDGNKFVYIIESTRVMVPMIDYNDFSDKGIRAFIKASKAFEDKGVLVLLETGLHFGLVTIIATPWIVLYNQQF